MNEKSIKPERITKPIQLLGAWLAGLFSINSCFLFASANYPSGSWESMALVVASIINVPLFLGAVFLLQTRYRPELQEDLYYSTYLSKKTNEVIKISKADHQFSELYVKVQEIDNKLNSLDDKNESIIENVTLAGILVGVNRHIEDQSLINSLAEHGIKRISRFGPVAEKPSGRVMSISEYLSEEIVDILLGIANELKIDGYNFFDPVSEESREDVLIGSYGNSSFEIIAKNA